MQPSAISVQDVYKRERTLLESAQSYHANFFEIGIKSHGLFPEYVFFLDPARQIHQQMRI